MRSMHIIGSREEGGAERFYLRLMRALVDSGEEVLCVLRPSSALITRLPEGVQVQAVRMRSIYDPFARARIASLARAFDAQIVQTYMGRATRLTRIDPKATHMVHVARVGNIHGIKGYRHAGAWIASTNAVCRHLIENDLPPNRVFRVRNLVDAPTPVSQAERQRLRAELGLDESHCLLACIGRLHRDRGVDVALDALARLPRMHAGRELRLLIVGEGSLADALREHAQSLGIAERVHWVPGAANPHPWAAIAQMLVYPSRESAVGTGVLEAWSYGLPVVASRTEGPAELITDGVTGFLAEPDDADDLARAIVRELDLDAASREAMNTAVQHKLAREHSCEAVAAAHVHVYRTLLP